MILSNEIQNKISKLYLAGKGGNEISKEINIGKYIIYKYLKSIKITRSNSESHRGFKSHLGFKHSEESKEKMRTSHIGQKSWNKDKIDIYSEETIEKMRTSHIGQIGYWLNKKRPEMMGDKNPSWNGGTSFGLYCSKFNKRKKEEIREQYNRKCYICGKDEKDNITKTNKQLKLCIHHIDGDKEQGCNGKQWKLIPLCINCHAKSHKTYH